MNAVVNPVSLARRLSELWSPRVIAEVDDSFVKVARLRGEFEWHAHEGEDELFYILDGSLRIEFDGSAVTLSAGELHVVPKGVRHRPVADAECLVMLIERKSTRHTGNEVTARTMSIEQQRRPLDA